MLDIKYIKENPEDVIERLARKGKDAREDIARILELDGQRRAMIAETEALKAEQNKVSKEIPKLKKEGKDVAPIFAEMKELSDKAKANDLKLRDIETEYMNLMLSSAEPARSATSSPASKENNEPIRYFGEPHKLRLPAEAPRRPLHRTSASSTMTAAPSSPAAASGSTRASARSLEWALLNYFIDCHLADGYEFILPPHMLEYQCGLTAGQFPKFADEVYKIENPTDDRVHYMLPDRRGRAREPLPRRGTERGGSAEEILRLHPLLPPRGRLLPLRRARHGPRTPVQQGRDVPVHPPGGLRRGLRRARHQGREPRQAGSASTSAPSSSPRATAPPPWPAPTTSRSTSPP